MEYTHINFKEQRDFGQVLNSTFFFIRQNFKKLGKALIYYVAPFILLQAISVVFYQNNVNNIGFAFRMHGIAALQDNFLIYFSIQVVAMFLNSVMLILTVYSYIKLYIENGRDGFTLTDVRRSIQKYFWRIVGAGFIGGLVVVIGFFMCILPGIYLGVSLSLMTLIIVIEDKSFGEAFSRSFKLSHYHWWWILLLLLVTYTIIYIVSLIFTIPQLIVTSAYRLHSVFGRGDDYEILKYLSIAITIISSFVSSFLMIMIYISLSFEYFSIVEKKESPTLLHKIEQLESEGGINHEE